MSCCLYLHVLWPLVWILWVDYGPQEVNIYLGRGLRGLGPITGLSGRQQFTNRSYCYAWKRRIKGLRVSSSNCSEDEVQINALEHFCHLGIEQSVFCLVFIYLSVLEVDTCAIHIFVTRLCHSYTLGFIVYQMY